MNMKAIFIVMSVIQAAVKRKHEKKIQDYRGFEPVTLVQCSTNWGNISWLRAGHYVGW